MHYEYEYYDFRGSGKPPYMRYGPFDVLTFLMSCITGLAILFSVACAIGYIADVAEEFPTRAKKILHIMAIGVLFVHGLILVLDQLSLWCSLVSIITNVLYLRILSGFPHLSLTHPLTILTIVSLVVELLSWYLFFLFSPIMSEHLGSHRFFSFTAFLWLMPLGLLVSLQIEPVGLPGSGFSASSQRHTDIAAEGRKKTVFNLLRGWLTPVMN
ncbi:hypothetical protein C3747_136g91 [Trypanosoma cruzi]|uniref:Transmembrane adaptor Erv26 n=2 Tax=Trypanosoma cruzi TaxID=5693 RepID=Q4CWL5_TRYCC|nr:hypothetical protein, conserved [Trypanosoma cruzi]EAN84662.1 hypothetical protein, conserved [Trypanosoma cruzi]PWV05196.1 hypothetical protein C3747_136g91 [Trypanosoma cruzi]RNC55476.1 hypothetical protein TcCL_ESM07032 [Trypanosoma cruzi]|eukprot:XP_806513.1 hypothetical protein [Trypanosoma cruzi strain CL Brener]